MNALQEIEYKGNRVLTTSLLAEAYGSETIKIQQNYNNNKERFIENKHFILLRGQELKDFLQLEIFEVQNPSKIRSLYLWTEKGAWLHAKSLNTDQAWEAYELLVDNYYRVIQHLEQVKQASPVATQGRAKISEKEKEAKRLLKLLKDNKEIMTPEAHQAVMAHITELLTGKPLLIVQPVPQPPHHEVAASQTYLPNISKSSRVYNELCEISDIIGVRRPSGHGDLRESDVITWWKNALEEMERDRQRKNRISHRAILDERIWDTLCELSDQIGIARPQTNDIDVWWQQALRQMDERWLYMLPSILPDSNQITKQMKEELERYREQHVSFSRRGR